MRISVVIPVLDEEKTIGATLTALMALAPFEAIVVDGGSTDRSRAIASAIATAVISAERGRARQMNRGAGAAGGDVLLFLHADTRLPASAFADIAAALQDPRYVGGRFDVELEGRHPLLKVIGAMINRRSRLTKVATGDQAIFVRRQVFERMGGFPDIPLMEDIAFCRALKRLGAIACLRSRAVTSARRWEAEGVCSTVLRMWLLKLLYFAGVAPRTLKRFYVDSR